MKKEKLKCLSGQYTTNVALHSGLVCWGGFGQPPCKHLLKCFSQFKDYFTPIKYKNIIKKIEKITNENN
jgi:hypothetical protein